MTRDDIDCSVIDDRGQMLKSICHGNPKRSIWFKGRPLPLCTRCTGFYLFLIIGLICGITAFIYTDISSIYLLLAFVVLVLPLAFDGWSQYVGWRRSNNPLRFITGALAGLGSGLAISYLVSRAMA